MAYFMKFYFTGMIGKHMEETAAESGYHYYTVLPRVFFCVLAGLASAAVDAEFFRWCVDR